MYSSRSFSQVPEARVYDSSNINLEVKIWTFFLSYLMFHRFTNHTQIKMKKIFLICKATIKSKVVIKIDQKSHDRELR